MNIIKETILSSLGDARTLLTTFIEGEDQIEIVERIAFELFHCLRAGGKVYSCGNGGSMCDAMHLAEELTGRFRRERSPLPGIAIADPSHITCVANDYGFEYIFSRYIEGHGKKGDLLFVLSTSGNSPNIINAVEKAHDKQMKVIGLLGRGGGRSMSCIDFPIDIAGNFSDRIQEMHIKIIHILIECLEQLYRQDFPKK